MILLNFLMLYSMQLRHIVHLLVQPKKNLPHKHMQKIFTKDSSPKSLDTIKFFVLNIQHTFTWKSFLLRSRKKKETVTRCDVTI